MSDQERETQSKEELAEELDRVFLRHMMQHYMQNYGERLLEEESHLPDTPESIPSASQLRRFKRRLHREAKKSNIPVRKIPRRFIPLVAVMIALLMISMITAGAYKLNLFSFLRIPSTTWTEYGSRETFGQVFRLGYIPDGFVESTYEITEDTVQIYYTHTEDKSQFFSVIICKDSYRLFSDSEDVDYIEPIKVNGISAEITVKNGLSSIAWGDSQTGLTYMLSSTLNQNESIKIAENISSNY